jgi:hypothetical protein
MFPAAFVLEWVVLYATTYVGLTLHMGLQGFLYLLGLGSNGIAQSAESTVDLASYVLTSVSYRGPDDQIECGCICLTFHRPDR